MFPNIPSGQTDVLTHFSEISDKLFLKYRNLLLLAQYENQTLRESAINGIPEEQMSNEAFQKRPL